MTASVSLPPQKDFASSLVLSDASFNDYKKENQHTVQ